MTYRLNFLTLLLYPSLKFLLQTFLDPSDSQLCNLRQLTMIKTRIILQTKALAAQNLAHCLRVINILRSKKALLLLMKISRLLPVTLVCVLFAKGIKLFNLSCSLLTGLRLNPLTPIIFHERRLPSLLTNSILTTIRRRNRIQGRVLLTDHRIRSLYLW